MDSWPHRPDVLVPGGGNAALTARQAGASVLLLESAPRVCRGGNSRHTRNLRYAHPGADGIAGSLSGGEQQMCAIGRALMAAPGLLVVDEMSLGLAPVVVDRLLDVLVRVRDQGTTVLLVEQDVFAAFSIVDRAYVMETGRIVREGNAAELQQDPDVRKAYLGVQ